MHAEVDAADTDRQGKEDPDSDKVRPNAARRSRPRKQGGKSEISDCRQGRMAAGEAGSQQLGRLGE